MVAADQAGVIFTLDPVTGKTAILAENSKYTSRNTLQ